MSICAASLKPADVAWLTSCTILFQALENGPENLERKKIKPVTVAP